MKPKAEFADAVSESKDCILVGDLAKLIKQNGIDIGSHRLFAWMRKNNYLLQKNKGDNNIPTQSAMNQGLLKTKEQVWEDEYGYNHIKITPLVTTKGQKHFVNKFLRIERQKIS